MRPGQWSGNDSPTRWAVAEWKLSWVARLCTSKEGYRGLQYAKETRHAAALEGQVLGWPWRLLLILETALLWEIGLDGKAPQAFKPIIYRGSMTIVHRASDDE